MFHDRPVIGIGCFFGGAVGTQGSVFVVKINLGDKPVSDFKDTAVPRGVVRGGGVEAGGVSGCLFSLGHGRPMASPRALFLLSTTAVRRVTASGAAFFAVVPGYCWTNYYAKASSNLRKLQNVQKKK